MYVSAFGKFLFTLCFLTWVHCLTGYTQVQPGMKADSISALPIAITAATTDPLNQVIVAWPDGRIQRYDSLVQKMEVEYSNPRFGAAAQLDASNPLHILAYYPDYLHVKLFNRNLILNATLNLVDLGYSQVPIMCTARDGNLWLYNALDFQFEKIDMQGKKLRSSIRINTVTEATPMAIFDTGDRLITILDNGSVGVFDAFGQYLGSIPFEKQTAYWLADQHILALKEGQISKLMFNTFEPVVEITEIPDIRLEMRFAGPNLFYMMFDGNTTFYKLTTNH